MVCNTYIFIRSNLLSNKNWKQNKKISNTALILTETLESPPSLELSSNLLKINLQQISLILLCP